MTHWFTYTSSTGTCNPTPVPAGIQVCEWDSASLGWFWFNWTSEDKRVTHTYCALRGPTEDPPESLTEWTQIPPLAADKVGYGAVTDYALHLHHNNSYEEYTANHDGTYQRTIYSAADRRMWTGNASIGLDTITQDMLQCGAWQCVPEQGQGQSASGASLGVPTCICDMMLLLSRGCQCGAMAAERAQVHA